MENPISASRVSSITNALSLPRKRISTFLLPYSNIHFGRGRNER